MPFSRYLFCHMPKCAGSSIRSCLPAILPNHSIVVDDRSFFSIPIDDREQYYQDCFISPVLMPPQTFVAGHLSPIRYLGSAHENPPDMFIFTFLRDPLDRLVSHYRFWRSGCFAGHYIWEKMNSCGWTFEQFALSAEMQNIYSQYIQHFDPSRFDFVGIHERLDDSWKHLCSIAGWPYRRLPLTNQTDSRVDQLNIPSSLRRDIRSFHDQDYLLYERAIDLLPG